MRLKIERIEDAGILEKERVVLRVLDDDDVGRYVIFKSKKVTETKVSSKIASAFWFQDQLVKKGDWVVVYTKIGVYKSSKNVKGETSHFFYWDKSVPVWTSSNDAVVLLDINEWVFKAPLN